MAAIPQIDHFMGYEVAEVGDHEDGWYVEFEGGARIYSKDPNYEKPDEDIVGKKLSMQTLSGKTTRLWFGTDDNPRGTIMNLNPLQYTISKPDYNDGEQISPQWPEELAVAGIEPSAPGERVVEGAEEQPEEDAESAADASEDSEAAQES